MSNNILHFIDIIYYRNYKTLKILTKLQEKRTNVKYHHLNKSIQQNI